MIGKQGLLHLAGFLNHINNNSTINEFEISDHAFLGQRWCIGLGKRWVQVALHLEGEALIVDYQLEGKGNVIIGVYDDVAIAQRVMNYLRNVTDEV